MNNQKGQVWVLGIVAAAILISSIIGLLLSQSTPSPLLYDVQIPPATTCEDMDFLTVPPNMNEYESFVAGYKGVEEFTCYRATLSEEVSSEPEDTSRFILPVPLSPGDEGYSIPPPLPIEVNEGAFTPPIQEVATVRCHYTVNQSLAGVTVMTYDGLGQTFTVGGDARLISEIDLIVAMVNGTSNPLILNLYSSPYKEELLGSVVMPQEDVERLTSDIPAWHRFVFDVPVPVSPFERYYFELDFEHPENFSVYDAWCSNRGTVDVYGGGILYRVNIVENRLVRSSNTDMAFKVFTIS